MEGRGKAITRNGMAMRFEIPKLIPSYTPPSIGPHLLIPLKQFHQARTKYSNR